MPTSAHSLATAGLALAALVLPLPLAATPVRAQEPAPPATTSAPGPVTGAAVLRQALATLGEQPFECLLVLTGRVDGNSYAATGTFAWQDGRHFALRIDGTGLGPEGETPGGWQVVADGEKVHLELRGQGLHGSFSYPQGTAGTLADLLPGHAAAALDGFWEGLEEVVLAPAGDGGPGAARHLRATLDRERFPGLQSPRADLVVELDAAGVPRRVTLATPEGDHVELRVTDLRRRSSFPEDRFVFQPAGGGEEEEAPPTGG